MTDFQGHMFPRNLSVSPSGGGGGTVTSVTASSPLTSSGGATPNIALTVGNLSDVGTDGIVVTGGTGSVIGSGTSIAQQVASATQNGYLSSANFSIFNNKQAALTIGNLTDAGTDGITVTGGTGSVIGSGTSIAQAASSASQNGYLSSANFTTFNSKVGGSGTAGQVAFFSGTSAITSSADLLFSTSNGLTNLLPSAFGNIATFSNGVVFDLEQQLINFSAGATLMNLNLELAPTGNTNVFSQAIYAEIQTAATAFNYNTNKGADIRAIHNGTGTIGILEGGSFIAQNSSTGTVSTNQGLGGSAVNDSSGNITLNTGLSASTTNAGTGTITTDRSLYIPVPGNNGTITTHYGIYMDNQNVGTTSYAIFTNLGKVSFGDQVIANALIDLTNIAAGSTVLKITKTNATPSTTWTAGATTSNPAGFIQITDAGGTKYIPYYS